MNLYNVENSKATPPTVVKHHTTKLKSQIPLPINIFVWRLTLIWNALFVNYILKLFPVKYKCTALFDTQSTIENNSEQKKKMFFLLQYQAPGKWMEGSCKALKVIKSIPLFPWGLKTQLFSFLLLSYEITSSLPLWFILHSIFSALFLNLLIH